MHVYKPEKNKYLSDKNIIDLSLGADHTLALAKNGSVFSFGSNIYGQLGRGSSGMNITNNSSVGSSNYLT
jgi:alpha-tubulin suppressor-like RCC1 family protein